MHDQDQLDAAIDRVAHAMTDAAPSGQLRETVGRRIAAPAPFAPAWRTWAMTAAAVAILVMAVAVWRGRPIEAPAPRVAALHSPGVERTATVADEERSTAARMPAPLTSDRPARGLAAATQTVIAAQSVTAAATDAVLVRPLAIDPIGSGGVEVETMPVPARVAIDPIAVTPMRLSEVDQQVE